MKTNNILDIIKGQNIVIPYVLLKNMKKLDINYKELIFLSYLSSSSSKILFDVS